MAHALVVTLYRITKEFPAEEQNGLTAEIRRSARRIADLIAEAIAQPGPKAMEPFLCKAISVASVLESGMILAQDLGYVAPPICMRLMADIAALRKVLLAAIDAVREPG
jgi:four helix bundle protein